MNLGNLLRRLAESFGAAVFPFRCLACGALYRPSSGASGASSCAPAQDRPPEVVFEQTCSRFVCPTCAVDVTPVTSPVCCGCGLVFKSRQGQDHFCGECLAEPKHFDSARAFGVYDGSLMALVHQFKYRGKSWLGAYLGSLMHTVHAGHSGHRPADMVAPVPLHARRFRKRGFNQAYLLVRDWPRAGPGAQDLASPRVERELLVRRQATSPQAGLGRRQRLTNIKHAFAVVDPSMIAGKRVLLVDDVMTTGATLNECARVLKVAGAAGVDCLTLARGL